MSQLHSLGMHANQLSRHTENPKLQLILQGAAVASIIVMGVAGTVHLYNDLTKPRQEWQPQHYPRHKHREMLDDLDRHYGGHGHGR